MSAEHLSHYQCPFCHHTRYAPSKSRVWCESIPGHLGLMQEIPKHAVIPNRPITDSITRMIGMSMKQVQETV